MLRINVTSVFVSDQDHALDFYTNVLGFEKKTEIPLGSVKCSRSSTTPAAT